MKQPFEVRYKIFQNHCHNEPLCKEHPEYGNWVIRAFTTEANSPKQAGSKIQKGGIVLSVRKIKTRDLETETERIWQEIQAFQEKEQAAIY